MSLTRAAWTVIALCLLGGACRRPNLRPFVDSLTTAPQIAIAGVACTFSATAVDPDTDMVAVRFDWGDGDVSDWSEFVPSGTPVTMAHAWAKGKYTLHAQARDEREAPSEWSSPHQITIRSPYPDSVIANVPAGSGADGIGPTISPDGAFLYVPGGDCIWAIRTSDNAIAARIDVLADFLAVSPDGRWLYASFWDEESILRVVSTDSYLQVDSIFLGAVQPYDIAVHPSGDRLYVMGQWLYADSNAIMVVRTADKAVIDSIWLDKIAWRLEMLPGGEHLYVEWDDFAVLVVSTRDNTVVDTIYCGGLGLEPSPDGQFVYRGEGPVRVIRTADHTVVDSLPIEVQDVAALPGGEYLYGIIDAPTDCFQQTIVISLEERAIIESLSVAYHQLYLQANTVGTRVYCLREGGMMVYGFSSRMRPTGGASLGSRF